MRDKLGIILILILGVAFTVFYASGSQQKQIGIELTHKSSQQQNDSPQLLGEINLATSLGNPNTKPVGLQVFQDKLWVTLYEEASVQVLTLEGLPLKAIDLKDETGGFNPNQMAFSDKIGVITDWASRSLIFRDAQQGKLDYYTKLPNGVQLEPQGIVAYKDIFYVANPPQKGWFAITGQGEVITGVDGRDKVEEALEFPFGMAVTKDGRVVVSDPVAGVVKFYSCVGWYGGTLTYKSFKNPMGLSLDSMERIHVVDNGTKKVLVFDSQGKFLFAYGKNLIGPTVIAVSPTTRTIYIGDTDGGKIQIWGY